MTDMTTKTPGQIAREAYGARHPEWEMIGSDWQAEWEASAAAVIEMCAKIAQETGDDVSGITDGEVYVVNKIIEALLSLKATSSEAGLKSAKRDEVDPASASVCLTHKTEAPNG
jgi:hypothetical protein